MSSTVDKGICGFDEEHINRTINPYDLYKNEAWRVWQNAWPYPNQTHHLVIPAVQHLTKLNEMTPRVVNLAHEAIIWSLDKYSVINGAIVFRFRGLNNDGDAFVNNGGTLLHSHFQLQAPNCLGPCFVTIGRPHSEQIGQTVEILSGKTYQPRYYDWMNGEYWRIMTAKDRPHTLQEYFLQPRRDFNILDRFAFGELFHLLLFYMARDIPGGALVLRFDNPRYMKTSGVYAKVIVADGTGPAIEVLHPAYNEGQAIRCMEMLVKKTS